jgi:LytS/YehU family sensor histidine kinase
LRFCRSLQRADRPGWTLLAAHAVAAIIFALGWTGTIYLLAWLSDPMAAWKFLTLWAPWQVLEGLLLYAATAAIAQSAWERQRLADQKLATTRAELHALRARLSPHFLFNSLNSMIQLAEEDPAATQAALLQLAELLRHVIRSDSNDPVELAFEQELGFIRSYLALERLRLGERLRIVEEIDPDTLDLSVPSFLLQPLVENAVQHGVAPRRSGATIRLAAFLSGDMLVLEVRDDGAGCPVDAWKGRQGLGLDIVQRQLEVRYPGESDMIVECGPGKGFSIRISLPATLNGARAI